MKKIAKPISKKYFPLKLYYENLTEIESVLKEEKVEYKIATNEFEYDTVDELYEKEKGNILFDIEIKTYSPYISIELNKQWTRCYIASSDTHNIGIFHKINNILTKTQLGFPWLYSYYTVWISIVILWTFNFLYDGDKIVSVIFNLFLFYYVSKVTYIRMFRSSIIIMEKLTEQTSFLKRNKDNLIIVIISALVGAIFGIIGTIITKKLIG